MREGREGGEGERGRGGGGEGGGGTGEGERGEGRWGRGEGSKGARVHTDAVLDFGTGGRLLRFCSSSSCTKQL